MDNKPEYANWLSSKVLMMPLVAGCIAAALAALAFLLNDGAAVWAVRVVLALAAIAFFALFAYFHHARRILAYDGGGVQGKVLDNVIRHLEWDGRGSILDIGCGSGAMAIKAARAFPAARVTGIDSWGAIWDYAKSQCERNAGAEGVADRVVFLEGDASRLDFPDDAFDAVMSNFVFHEVRSQPDKSALIREALRVLKPGGAFSFGDVFFSKTHYRDLPGLIDELSKDVASLTFVDTRKSDFVPKFLRSRLLLGNMGLMHGRK